MYSKGADEMSSNLKNFVTFDLFLLTFGDLKISNLAILG